MMHDPFAGGCGHEEGKGRAQQHGFTAQPRTAQAEENTPGSERLAKVGNAGDQAGGKEGESRKGNEVVFVIRNLGESKRGELKPDAELGENEEKNEGVVRVLRAEGIGVRRAKIGGQWIF
jgi:hypothetical protein